MVNVLVVVHGTEASSHHSKQKTLSPSLNFVFSVSQNIFCACSLFLKTLLRICNCLLVHVFFFPNLSLIIVCSVVGVTRTSAAGHPLHQAVSCHLLSFHFIVSVFFSSFLFYDHCVCFILLKNSCFALFFIS